MKSPVFANVNVVPIVYGVHVESSIEYSRLMSEGSPFLFKTIVDPACSDVKVK